MEHRGLVHAQQRPRPRRPEPARVYEAEDGELGGAAPGSPPTTAATPASASWPASGEDDASTTVDVDVDEAGEYDVGLRYSNGPNPFQGTKTVSVYVGEVRQTVLPSTVTWKTVAASCSGSTPGRHHHGAAPGRGPRATTGTSTSTTSRSSSTSTIADEAETAQLARWGQRPDRARRLQRHRLHRRDGDRGRLGDLHRRTPRRPATTTSRWATPTAAPLARLTKTLLLSVNDGSGAAGHAGQHVGLEQLGHLHGDRAARGRRQHRRLRGGRRRRPDQRARQPRLRRRRRGRRRSATRSRRWPRRRVRRHELDPAGGARSTTRPRRASRSRDGAPGSRRSQRTSRAGRSTPTSCSSPPRRTAPGRRRRRSP